MARKARQLSIQELFAELTGSLRRTSVRPTIEGYTAQDHQEPFHCSMATGRAFMGGNRAGKTVAGSAETVMWLTGRHKYRPTPPPPVHGRSIAVDFDRGVEKILKPEVARWIPPSELVKGSWETSYSRELRTLTLNNGSTLEFMSYEQSLEKFAGTSRHFIHFDEEPPEDIFNENMARLIDTKGSWWLTMTPVEGMTWVYDRIYLSAATNTNIDVFEAGMDQNKYVSSPEIDVYLEGLSNDEKQARRHGKFVQLGGLIYDKSFDYKRNVIEPILPRLGGTNWDTYLKRWAHFRSMDHGFHNPTCWLWMCADEEGRIIVYDEYYVAGEVISYHAREVRERTTLNGIDPVYSVGDPSIHNTDPITGTSIQLEYIDYGVAIAEGNNDVRAGINRVANLLENKKLYITRNCEKLLWEIQRYRWKRWLHKKTAADNNVKDEPTKKDDHACDALRYGVASRFTAEIEQEVAVQNPLGLPLALLRDAPRYDRDYSDSIIVNSILGDDW